ncbi:tetratricopeptide repeat protein [Tumebacillus sp. DT12]|uniref:Tetratricopeptide repeat protein n=1 Tax=Tumebacillus lacus TaxID=2995335 RepID=A0ABT3WZ96_9BACL|nr:helix-turn-helix domain-containing protein [Tumebacillus lacus]MCX7569979.1 tetratricopeptide repeat protein [Tumebacillus lacus]
MKNEAFKSIGGRVRNYRLNRGFSQDELAEGICSRQTISFLENGQHLPSPEFLKKIADRLGVPFHEIMIDDTDELSAKIKLEVINIYIERNEYTRALDLIDHLQNSQELLEYQKRELELSKVDCLLGTNQPDAALEALTDLQMRLELQREPDDHLMAVVYNKLGTANYRLWNISNAHAHYMRAYQLTLRFQGIDVTAARIAYNLGMASRLLNLNTDAVQYLSVSENFFKDISDLDKLAHTWFELGIAYQSMGDLGEAEKYLQEAHTLYKSQNALRFARLVKESYAFTVLSKQDPDKAIDEMFECAKETEHDGDLKQVAYIHARIAKLLIGQKRLTEAEKVLEKALTLFTEKEASSCLHFVHVYQSFAEYLCEIKQYEKSIQYSYLASDLFDKMGFIKDAAESLSTAVNAFRYQGMFEQALEVSDRVCNMLRRATHLR